MAKFNETRNSSINLISNGTEITGDMKSNGDIRIDGALTGNLNTKGKVVIGPTGKVNGEVICKNSEVSGIVEGKITVGQLLNLKASSKIIGDIATSKLSIEPGAIFSGNCKMSDNDNNGGAGITKKKNPKNRQNNGYKDYAKYSGMAFQMIGIILVAVWGGVKLDKMTGWHTPVFTIILSLLGVFAAIYTAVKDFIK